MNKTAIKNFAIWARVTLIEAVKQKAFEYEIKKGVESDERQNSVNGRLLTETEKDQRVKLISQIKDKGYDNVMEEVAYTWFNRFIALRYMEVNGFLPDMVRVFSDENGDFKPDILKEAMTVEIDGLNRDKVLDMIDRQETDELYKYLLITQCNALGKCLPGMFEKIENYTELLFPNNLLKADSVIAKMISDIPEEDWTDQVQIIGWMYQYYISEKHDEIVNIYKGTVKKDDIPAATQLFTTDWVVRYMVDNSLGRYWIERHPESKLYEKLEYYVKPKNGDIIYINESVTPQELTFFDPCMGSGHILVYAFDVLMDIYKECGYNERDAVSEIIQHNIYGMDIDNRCSQLAYFAVMMKARNYDRRFLTRGIFPHVVSIQESNYLGEFVKPKITKDLKQNKTGEYLYEVFKHAKEIGSLQTVEKRDYDAFLDYLNEIQNTAFIDMEYTEWQEETLPIILNFVEQAKILSGKYAVVCTNPPYMNKLEGKLKEFVVNKYKDYSGDLFSVFMYRNFGFCKADGYSAFMTPFVWMFIKTYENLRTYIISSKAITTLCQMEYSAFEEATVPICSFVLQNCKSSNKALCFRLSDFKGGMDVQKQKVLKAISDPDCGYFYEADQSNFSKIPGSPVAYWVSEKFMLMFEKGVLLGKVADSKQGLATADNNRFLREWYEVENSRIKYDAHSCSEAEDSGKKWFPYNKGGEFRKWYGNNDYVVNWEMNGFEIRNFYDEKGKLRSRPQNTDFYFRKSGSWSLISSSVAAFRYKPYGHIFDVAGMSFFSKDRLKYLLALCNTNIVMEVLAIIAPTINYQCGDIANIPVIFEETQRVAIEQIVDENIAISRADWDAFETSWDFKKSPLV